VALPSILYEPPGRPSLFECWESGAESDLPAPLAVRDSAYRSRILSLVEDHRGSGSRLVSVGAGTGRMEVELAAAGWAVLATDSSEAAIAHCRAKGLVTAQFTLTEDQGLGGFDVVYCDGVLGHLWESTTGCQRAWHSLAELGSDGALCLASNDLSDDDRAPRFGVRASPDACYFRPPAGCFAAEAAASGQWTLVSQSIYPYERAGVSRRREVIMLRLLVDDRIEAKDGVQLPGE
jgi:SAM-dependent methyltransferase